MLKNSSKGDQLEAIWSEIIHANEIPVLVSSLYLREMGAGQIDICSISKKKLKLYEVKNTPEAIGQVQYKRLNKSLELLTNILNAPGQIIIKSNCQKI